jgi:hypothetical protein
VKQLAQILVSLGFFLTISFIIYLFKNQWWGFMLLLTPMIIQSVVDDNSED